MVYKTFQEDEKGITKSCKETKMRWLGFYNVNFAVLVPLGINYYINGSGLQQIQILLAQ
jgi:hypothetical protein